MILVGNQATQFAEQIKPHIGHDLEIATYGHEGEIWDVAIECMTCGMVLIDADLTLEPDTDFRSEDSD